MDSSSVGPPHDPHQARRSEEEEGEAVVSENVTLVSYGGGTNSTAMLCGMVERGEPAPHAILFADTGAGENRPGEKPHTYRYVRMFSGWLVSRGYPPITTIRKGGRDETLEEKCLRLKVLPSVAYGWKTCSHAFKIEPQEKWANNDPACRAAWVAGDQVIKLIGYHADEPHRAKPYCDTKYVNRYPLIEWRWGQEKCQEAIGRAGLTLPGKSACFFCPNSTKAEIQQLSEQYPPLAQRALEMEANADLTVVKGLGRRFSWADLLRQGEMFSMPPMAEAQMPCGCIDGE